MAKKSKITLEDKIRLALTKPKRNSERVMDQSSHSVISRWVQEFKITPGTKPTRAGKIYAEFKEWCKLNNIHYVPSMTLFGMVVKKIITFKKIKDGVNYYMNLSLEELENKRKTKYDQEKED